MQTETLIEQLLHDRAHRAGKISEAQAHIDKLKDEVKALECAVRVYKPDHEFEGAAAHAVRKKAERKFARGDFQRAIIAVLKRSDGPLTAKEIGTSIRDEKGIETVQAQLSNQLSTMKRSGYLDFEKINGATFWKIAKPT